MSELFSEMLQRDFGLHLYHSLCSLPQTATLPDSEVQAEDCSTAVVHTPYVKLFIQHHVAI